MIRAVAILPLYALLVGCGGWGVSVPGGKDIRTPLEIAAQGGNLVEVQRLLGSGADPNYRGGAFGSPLNAAVHRDQNVEVIRALIAAGAKPDGRGEEANGCWVSPLSDAAYAGELDNVRTLLDSGAVLRKSRCANLVFGWLKPPVIDLLVQRGFDVFAIDELGRNPLHVALTPPAVPSLAGIEYLIRAGVPLNARDHAGKTPLACWREPHDPETHWFMVWLVERLGDGSEFRQQRENRAKISALLERSGARL